MPARAFFVFGQGSQPGRLKPSINVLMPARAFFVFGQILQQQMYEHWWSSNAREGIFCFWTTSALRHRRKIPVLMPARAFFVFGPGMLPDLQRRK